MRCDRWHGLAIDSGFHVKLIRRLNGPEKTLIESGSIQDDFPYLHFICVPYFDCCVITRCNKHPCIKREPWYWGDSIFMSIRSEPLIKICKFATQRNINNAYLAVLATGSFLMCSAGIACKSNTCTLPSPPPDNKLYRWVANHQQHVNINTHYLCSIVSIFIEFTPPV